MTAVLIVDDDIEMRAALRRILKRGGGFEVAGEAGSLRQALRLVQDVSPDVVLVRCGRRDLDAVEVTAEIMTVKASPVVVVTDPRDAQAADCAFRAMSAGAVAATSCPGEDATASELAAFLQTVRTMAEVRVVHRRPARIPSGPRHAGTPPKSAPAAARRRLDLIVVGASTGGPQALQSFLSALPRPLTLPVLVVQHITPDFQGGFAHWLGEATGLRTALAGDGDSLRPGSVLIAPHPYQMGVDTDRKVVLRRDPPEHGVRPSVSYLFRSILDLGPRHTAAVLLTGMGRDGAEELLQLHERGVFTIAQDADSSVVHGMPGTAIRLGAADEVLPPDEAGQLLGWMMSATASGDGPESPVKGRAS
jgi:two-component system, chemotaxis family, protein-glutamate methylesterase/glutaminase